MFKKRILIIILILLAPLALSARNSTIESMGVKIAAVPGYNGRCTSGYVFYRVTVSNRSGEEKNIRLFMNSSYSGELEQVTRRFKIAAGETRVESLFFPVMDFSSQGMKVEIDGYVLQENLFDYLSHYRDYYRKRQTLVDNRIARSEFEAVFGSGRGSHDVETSSFDGSYGQMDSSWLGYSQFNSLIFYAESLAQMTPETRIAIFNYVRAGASMMILGNFELPSDFVAIEAKVPENLHDFRAFSGGFGRILMTQEDALTQVATASGNPFPDLNQDPFASINSRSRSPLTFTDQEVKTVSVQWLMIIIYIFAFVIGPVNVYVLHKLEKKIWVFWTVPVASAICCLFIFAYYWLFESSTLLVKKRALTLLDERNNQAITLGNFAVYSSASRADGFKFSYDTEVRPIMARNYRNTDGGKIINLDDGQNFAEGWIRPKIPRYLHLRTVHLRRERLTIEKGGNDEFQILNGLGARAKRIMVRMADGKLYECSGVKPGDKASLFLSNKMVSNRSSRKPVDLYEMFNSEWYDNYDFLIKEPEYYLNSGMYIAVLDGTPFIDKQSFERSDSQEDSVVIGYMSNGGQL
ncbi:MAG: hypothetical protein ACOYXC_14035 [Candidatus Rifleibacteriota bacterium]